MKKVHHVLKTCWFGAVRAAYAEINWIVSQTKSSMLTTPLRVETDSLFSLNLSLSRATGAKLFPFSIFSDSLKLENKMFNKCRLTIGMRNGVSGAIVQLILQSAFLLSNPFH